MNRDIYGNRFDRKRLTIMHLLIEYKADVSIRAQDDEIVLYRAFDSSLIQKIELLLDKRALVKNKQNHLKRGWILSRPNLEKKIQIKVEIYVRHRTIL